jgi:arylsulfatase A-like enzyme
MAPRKKAAASTRRAKRSSTDKPNILIIWGDDIGWSTSAPTTTA